jgi:hypothetical protein
MDNTLLLYIICSINIIFFLLGYFFAKFRFVQVADIKSKNKTSLVDKLKNSDIQIDNKKVVLQIKTNDLEKKYDTLGETKVTKDNISNSVNKLKNIKS